MLFLGNNIAYPLAFADDAPIVQRQDDRSYKLKFWQGHKVRFDAGIFGVVNSLNATANPGASDRNGIRTGPMLELGYEYGWVFSEAYYFGIDATWTAFIPDSFQNQNITLAEGEPVSPEALLLAPIVHFHFGYITDDNTLWTIGFPYFLGSHRNGSSSDL